jgi:stage II sporulation protein AB (anti-sigma F factor)
MTQRKMQSQVEEEDMLEENRPEVLRMEIESLSRNEEFARVVVSVFMARMNPTLEELDDVKTAVSEAVTNAVIHGYQGNGGIIYLEVEILKQELTVTVRDTGIGIPNIVQAMEPMFTTDPEGERSGMGFSFMEAFMDEVRVESEPDKGTVVTMKKKING